MTATDAQLRAILTRAATVEAERQAARERRDWPAVAAAERELAVLWRQHADLERQAVA
jgi:hypothetical protein